MHFAFFETFTLFISNEKRICIPFRLWPPEITLPLSHLTTGLNIVWTATMSVEGFNAKYMNLCERPMRYA